MAGLLCGGGDERARRRENEVRVREREERERREKRERCARSCRLVSLTHLDPREDNDELLQRDGNERRTRLRRDAEHAHHCLHNILVVRKLIPWLL